MHGFVFNAVQNVNFPVASGQRHFKRLRHNPITPLERAGNPNHVAAPRSIDRQAGHVIHHRRHVHRARWFKESLTRAGREAQQYGNGLPVFIQHLHAELSGGFGSERQRPTERRSARTFMVERDMENGQVRRHLLQLHHDVGGGVGRDGDAVGLRIALSRHVHFVDDKIGWAVAGDHFEQKQIVLLIQFKRAFRRARGQAVTEIERDEIGYLREQLQQTLLRVPVVVVRVRRRRMG